MVTIDYYDNSVEVSYRLSLLFSFIHSVFYEMLSLYSFPVVNLYPVYYI